MGTEIFLGEPPPRVKQWIKDRRGPVVKETTAAKYTAESGLPGWEGDIVGELTIDSIPNISNAEVVEIGSHVTSIGTQAFYSCDGLTSVTIPNSVTEIGNSAFDHCNGLTNVAIPSSVVTFGNNIIMGCNNLHTVNLPGRTMEDADNLS